MTARPNETFSCLLCGTTTPLPHDCPAIYREPFVPLSPPEEERPSIQEELRDTAHGCAYRGMYATAELLREAAERITRLEADLAAARSALKQQSAHAVALAEVNGVERPSLGGASPHRFNDTDREIL